MRGIVETEKRMKIQMLASQLPRVSSNSIDGSANTGKLYQYLPRNLVEETVAIVSNYVSEREWGSLVKVAIDRAIRYYERETLLARSLVKTRNIDTDFYQWIVGGSFAAEITTPGALKKTVQLDLSSRIAKVVKAGLALEILDETREAMSPDMMSEAMRKVAGAFDELETSVIMETVFGYMVDNVRWKGIFFDSHILNATATGYTAANFDHEKMTDMLYLLEKEGYKPDTMIMGRDIYWQLMELEPFKDTNQKWTSSLTPAAVNIIEGGAPNKPLLPGMSLLKIAVTNYAPSGQVVIYDSNEYAEFLIREPLNSEQPPHDALRDRTIITFRERFGSVATEPLAAVKMINVGGKNLTNKF